MSKRKATAEYTVLRGISWRVPDGWVDVEAGEIRSDLPTEHIAGWIDCGAIEPKDTSGEPAAEEA